MPEYHRGKMRSPYRKRGRSVAVTHTSAGIEVQAVLLANSTGLVVTKSWRGTFQVRGSSSGQSSGWLGFNRSQLGASALEALPENVVLAMSETFGVVPWTSGINDHLYELSLLGVTLSVAESLYLVSGCTFQTGGTVAIRGQLMYAELEVPA